MPDNCTFLRPQAGQVKLVSPQTYGAPERKYDSTHVGVGPPRGYEGGGSGRRHPENADRGVTSSSPHHNARVGGLVKRV